MSFVTNKAESSRLATVILHDDATHDLTVGLEQLKHWCDVCAIQILKGCMLFCLKGEPRQHLICFN